MIRLRGVWFTYDGRDWALRGVTAEFSESRLYIVRGPNGGGKTTLLKVASLLYRPTRGSVEAWGVDYWASGAPVYVRRRVAYVHDRPVMIKGRVVDNIAYSLIIRGVPRAEALAMAREVLSSLGLEGLAGRDARSLSAGQAQLVSILRALIVEPRIIFLDEPASFLDTDKRGLLSSLVEEALSRGSGVVMATNTSLGRLEDEAHRVYLVEEGTIRPY